MEQVVLGKGRRLDSWKAIALHLDRDVRSVQRWEHERGLPVYRVPGQKGGAVFAYESELDSWLLSGGNGAVPDTGSIIPSAAGGNLEYSAYRKPFVWAALALAMALVVGLVFLRRSAEAPVPAPPRAAPPILAVLPMANLSGDPGQEYFADGFTDELVTDLAQIRALRVISRTSTLPYKGSRKPLPQIARELHARYVLEGSVVREGARVRVTAQLIDAKTDTHISAHSYVGAVKDVFDVEDRISRAIVNDVDLDLSPGERARLAAAREIDPQAHDLYLKASYAFAQQTPDSIRQSLTLYKAAANKAPSFARAYLGIAQAETALLQITAESPAESVRREKEALAKALTIDPHLGDAHGMLATLTYTYDWDWPRAEREFRVALAEGAQAPTEQRFGAYLITRGQFEEGTAHVQKALELDPLGNSPRVNQFFGLYFQRKFADASRELVELLAQKPDFLAGHALLGLVSMIQHNCRETAAQAEWVGKHFASPLASFESALASICANDPADARRYLATASASNGRPYASPYQLALGYAAIHDHAAALSYLEKSAAIREPQILYLKVEPLFDGLRREARYIALEQRLGLLG
jgi:TolB-like protein/Tfp pilus assembly protein PilF